MKYMAPENLTPHEQQRIARNTFENGDMQTAVNETGIFAVDKAQADRPIMRAALMGDMSEPRVIRFMANRCGSGDVVQAGAYYGDFLPALSSAAAPGAIVWTFEPHPHSAELARRTIALNRLRNVRLLPNALSEETSDLHLAVTSDGRSLGGLSRIVENNHKDAPDDAKESSLPVAGVRLDDVIPREREVSIIQLDLEGYEPNALRGASDILQRHRPILILEMRPHRAAETVHQIVPDLNYVTVGRFGQNSVLVSLDDDILTAAG